MHVPCLEDVFKKLQQFFARFTQASLTPIIAEPLEEAGVPVGKPIGLVRAVIY